jgi:flagellar hook-length control protein FliK
MRVPTLQPAAGSAATATTTQTTDSDESESAPDQIESAAAASALGTPEITKTATEPVAFALNTDGPAPGAQQNSLQAAPADTMPSAAAAAAAAQAGPLHSSAHSQAVTDAPPTLRAPVGSAAWTEELGARLTFMTRQGQDSASLHLSPDHLGPVEVRIDVRDGATSVWFGAAHAETRSALEQSLPRLRELFAASGLLLADAGVARDAPRQNSRPVAPSSFASSARDTSVNAPQAASASTHSGLVDTYV